MQRSKLQPFWSPWRVEKIFGDQNSGERESYLKNYQWYLTNLINSSSGGITCLFLLSSRRSETRYECVNLLQQKRVVRHINHSCNRSWSVLPSGFFLATCNMSWSVLPFTFCFFLFGDWIFVYGDHCTINSRQKATFWKCELGALWWC